MTSSTRALSAHSSPRRLWSPGSISAALALILAAIVVGVMISNTAIGAAGMHHIGGHNADGSGGIFAQNGQHGAVAATGEVTKVEVHAGENMRFSPASISVPAGNELVITLINDDPMNQHDLVIGEAESGRVAPGERTEFSVGVIGQNVQGYCSVAGHRQMGMVFDVHVEGAPTQANSNSHTAHQQSGSVLSSRIAPIDDAHVKEGISPELTPLESNSGPITREYTFTVSELALEVAPGLYQKRWTFNGKQMGPVLHGRVGDTFRITLVNDGSMGHSIDFHAGDVSPDAPMRTIAPGESLVYEFTARRAGIWMYHCSTKPMSTHIAAGMHGAVVIEPEGLAQVDHEYVMVQSEIYLANAATSAKEAQEVDSAKIDARRPDRLAFNGIANQYDDYPLDVAAGDSVRMWVLNAGPNEPLAFHVVGAQFDSVWAEGGYRVKDGRDAFGSQAGGSQALGLQPAEGGFVEMTIRESGHYTFVNHVMSNAELGAHGIIHAR